MQTFTQKLSPEPYVKSEVSDKTPLNCDTADDESCPSTPLQPSNSSKRSSSELDSYTSSSEALESAIQPRKRAKTQEEKEQRKLARVIRNRQAAQASREKKRIYLENLEEKCNNLEVENTNLRNSLSQSQELNCRLEQYESAINMARETGDISSLDSIVHLIGRKPATQVFDGTITGSMLNVQNVTSDATVSNAAPKHMADDEPSNSNITPNSLSADSNSSLAGETAGYTNESETQIVCSPAPSLEEDRSSPESHGMRSEEEDYFFSPLTGEPEIKVEHDPFEVLNFSFDTKPAFSGVNDLDKTSKSRHSAAMTSILVDY